MNYKKIPGTDLSVSSVALGTWVFGGADWGGSEEKDCLAAVCKALDSGINLIDTAPVYGFGRAETIVGKALKGSREKALIATKCGLVKDGNGIKICLAPDSVTRELEASLCRLNTDHVDLYQIHWPDDKTPLEETLACMLELKKQGKIRHIGVSNFSLEKLKQAMNICRIASIQNEFSFLKKAPEEMLAFCEEKGVGFLAYGSLAGGILTGKYKESPSFRRMDARSYFYKFYKGPGFERAQKAVHLFEELARVKNRPVAQCAINWTAQQKGIASVIAGGRNPAQVEANAGSADWFLSESEMKILNGIEI